MSVPSLAVLVRPIDAFDADLEEAMANGWEKLEEPRIVGARLKVCRLVHWNGKNPKEVTG